MACSNECIPSRRESVFYPSHNLYVEQNGKQRRIAVSHTDYLSEEAKD